LRNRVWFGIPDEQGKPKEEILENERTKREDHSLICSFCGKSQKEVRQLIAGPTVYICDECIGRSDDILLENGFDVREDRGSAKPLKQSVLLQRDVKNLLGRIDAIESKLSKLHLFGELARHSSVPNGSSIDSAKSAIASLAEPLRAAREHATHIEKLLVRIVGGGTGPLVELESLAQELQSQALKVIRREMREDEEEGEAAVAPRDQRLQRRLFRRGRMELQRRMKLRFQAHKDM